MKKQQSGFTLIELIMVIVILGILSAFALPRFAELGNDARIASLNGLAGSLRSAAAITHAEWLAQGSTGVVTLEGQPITLTAANGYPDAVALGITRAAQVDAAAYPASADAVGGTLTYTLRTNCTAAYNAATVPPTVTVVTTGC